MSPIRQQVVAKRVRCGNFLRMSAPVLRIAALSWLLVPTLLRASEEPSFNRDIRPILSDNCFSCHGFDSKKRKAGLRLDVPEGAHTPNKDGLVAFKPGDPAGSEGWKRILTADPDDVMPPPDSHKQLTAEQKDTLKRWIEAGAVYQKHWAFETPVRPPVPPEQATSQGAASANPIDRFLRKRLAAERLEATPEAPRETLIRRLSFDLRGLPPTPSEVDEFLADHQPVAYERVVDHFLASPQYGEHMGRHWLDVARYADTHGLHLDNERQMWAYRDWVVKAFNRNLGFDRFTIEQLAGDLLPEADTEQLIATGFNRCNVTTAEGGAIDEEWIFRYAVERTSTTVQAWMGLTAGCAVCHDHKFDPISNREFYSLYAFFHSAADPAMDGNALRTVPTVQIKSDENQRRLAELDRVLGETESRLTNAVTRLTYTDPATLPTPPPALEEEAVWFDDDPPAGAKASEPPTYVSAESGKVFSGAKAIRRDSTGVSQDVFESDTGLGTVPANARLFVNVYLDPANPPKAVMIQWRRGGWDHRAVWGNPDFVEWGEKGKGSRYPAGPLPPTGQWTRLEVPAEKVDLKAGDTLKGLAFTQDGGRVYWDKAGAAGRIEPAVDPLWSLAVWTKQNDGKDVKDFPGPIRKIFKDVATTNRTPEHLSQLRDYYVTYVCTETKRALESLSTPFTKAKKERDDYNDSILQSFIWRDLEKPRDSFVMMRGQYDKPGDRVTRAVPAVFPALRPRGPSPDRLDLAQWLLSPEHPLTARVTVNRFWQQFFGVGLVRSSDDFGSQGTPPTHPELLDWMAVNFRESGWDVKALVRLMVTSAAYRQHARVTPEVLNRDPENLFLARGPRFRLDAEQLRDNALFVSGLLDPTMGGKGVKPYQPPNIWEPVGFVGSNTRDYKQDTGSALYRRGLYVFLKRTAPPPFLSTFDAPNREQFCTRRERSNTPLQALQLLNDVQYFEAARGLAGRMLLEGGKTTAERLTFGYRTVLARTPSPEELHVVTEALDQHLARYVADPAAARAAVTFGESKPPAGLPETELAAYTLAANLLLNLDETIVRN
jgi:hypothetical protein